MHPPPIAPGTLRPFSVYNCPGLPRYIVRMLYSFAMETSPQGGPPRYVKILLQALDVFMRCRMLSKVLVLTLDVDELEESMHTCKTTASAHGHGVCALSPYVPGLNALKETLAGCGIEIDITSSGSIQASLLRLRTQCNDEEIAQVGLVLGYSQKEASVDHSQARRRWRVKPQLYDGAVCRLCAFCL